VREVWTGTAASPEGADELGGQGRRRVTNTAGVVNVEGQGGGALREGVWCMPPRRRPGTRLEGPYRESPNGRRRNGASGVQRVLDDRCEGSAPFGFAPPFPELKPPVMQK
jgi:hypothetical protein